MPIEWFQIVETIGALHPDHWRVEGPNEPPILRHYNSRPVHGFGVSRRSTQIADVLIIEPDSVDVTRARTTAILQTEVEPASPDPIANVPVIPNEPAVRTVGLTGLIMAAKSQSRDDSYIQNLLNVAAQRGWPHVPAGLITAEGSFDAQALEKDGQAGALGVNIALQNRAYTVKSTDSLSGIAYQYYGTTDAVLRIFAANRDTLDNPDLLTSGQVLRLL